MSDTKAKLDYLNETKNRLMAVINQKGGDIKPDTPFRGYVSAIAGLENARAYTLSREELGQHQAMAFSGGWLFGKNENSMTETVSLPHTVNAADCTQASMYRGKTYYKKTLTLTADEAKRPLFLHFDQGGQTLQIYVNQTLVLTHFTGYTPFATPDLREYVRAGENEIKVVADNSLDYTTIPVSGDFSFANGLYGNVTVHKCAMVHADFDSYGSTQRMHVAQEAVTKKSATICVRAGLTNDMPSPVDITAQVTISLGSYALTKAVSYLLPASSTTPIEVLCEIKNPVLWCFGGKNMMYTVTLKLSSGEQIEILSAKAGLRTVSLKPDAGIFVNDERVMLRGVAMHQDDPDVFAAITKAGMARDIAIVDDIGCNAVRLAHYPHKHAFMDLLDERGILAQTEIPWVNNCGAGVTDAFRERIVYAATEMVREYFNHPCIFAWGLSNELGNNHAPATATGTQAFSIDLAKSISNEAYWKVREIDSKRLIALTTDKTTYASIGFVTDMWFLNIYKGWYTGTFADLTPVVSSAYASHNRSISIGEYGAGANPYHHSDKPLITTNIATGGERHDEEYQNLFHESYLKQIIGLPYLGATFVWALFDFASYLRSEGGVKGINDKGLVTRDRTLFKDAYYLYRAYWQKDVKQVYITGRRFTKRETDKVIIKVYSNASALELHRDGLVQRMNAPTDSVTGVIWQFDPVSFQGDKQNTFEVRGFNENGELVGTDSVTLQTTAKLPDGYVRALAVKSAGDSYVDTGYIPNQSTRVKATIAHERVEGENEQSVLLFGARTAMFQNAYGLRLKQVDYGAASPTNTVYNLGEVDFNGNKLYLNGQLSMTLTEATFSPNCNLYIFANNNGGSVINASPGTEISAFQIYDGDQLVRDFVPCMHEATGHYALYDALSDKVYESKTSTPLEGRMEVPEVTLPDGYVPALCVTSVSDSYIDTGIVPNQSTRVKAHIEREPVPQEDPQAVLLFGARAASRSKAYGLRLKQADYGFELLTNTVNNLGDVDFNANQLSVNGTLCLTLPEATFDSGCNLYIFANNNNGSAINITPGTDISAFQIIKGGQTVRDFVPIKHTATGAYALYDKVSQQVFESKTSTPLGGRMG